MHQFKEQIERISTKLKAAKQKDKQLKVFGASYHKYTIHPPLEEAQQVLCSDIVEQHY
ncbi:mRNA degradation ribonuclease J1/J2 [Chitinophaga sp. W2I13]|uniref:hypothetical protein n=1 Tax=Chitinophaga sp. W2I13 TaxID=3373923 RepID=UPI003D1AC89D